MQTGMAEAQEHRGRSEAVFRDLKEVNSQYWSISSWYTEIRPEKQFQLSMFVTHR